VIASGALSQEGPAVLKARQAAKVIGVSLRTWWTWHAAGQNPLPIPKGRRLFWRTAELYDWVEAGMPDRAEWEAMRLSQHTCRRNRGRR
jgi:predicted DNA-binding transcriptional regulator AlpA